MVLSGMLFTFLLSGCSSNGVNPEVIFSILGTMDWGRTEFGQGDSGNEPTGTHNSTPNDSRYCEYKDDGTYIITYIYGPETMYSLDGNWEIDDDVLILDKGNPGEERWRINQDGKSITMFRSFSVEGVSEWEREYWTQR